MSGGVVRVAVIGTGFGARVVAPAFAACEGCEVVAVVSARDPVAVARACRAPDVDLVSIHSPPFLHAEHVRLALDAGRAVLCDKPFSTSAAESERLHAEAERAGVLHVCNFEFRRDRARRALRDVVVSGELGSPEHVVWVHLSSGSRVPLRPHGWLFERARGGGWVGAWASHAIDTLRWMLGEVVDVSAQRRTDVPVRPDLDGVERRGDAEDGLTANLRLDRGTTVVLDSSFAAPVSLSPRLVVVGSAGVAELVGGRRLVVRCADQPRREVDLGDGAVARDGDRHAAPMETHAAAVVEAVRSGSVDDDMPTFADGVACDRVLDAMRAAPRVVAAAS
jgi:predicted dehydrogenase